IAATAKGNSLDLLIDLKHAPPLPSLAPVRGPTHDAIEAADIQAIRSAGGAQGMIHVQARLKLTPGGQRAAGEADSYGRTGDTSGQIRNSHDVSAGVAAAEGDENKAMIGCPGHWLIVPGPLVLERISAGGRDIESDLAASLRSDGLRLLRDSGGLPDR